MAIAPLNLERVATEKLIAEIRRVSTECLNEERMRAAMLKWIVKTSDRIYPGNTAFN